MTPAPGLTLTRRTHPTATAAVPGEDLDAATVPSDTAPMTGVDVFLAAAAHRRAQRTLDATRPADWEDPDPGAGRNLAPRNNPVARVLKASKEGHSRDVVRGNVRMACAMLQGVDHRTLTHDGVLAYPWHQLSVDQAIDLRVLIYKTYTNQGTRNDKVSAVRRVITECFKVGLISALRRELLLEALFTTSPGPSMRRRRLSQHEISALLEAAENLGSRAAQARNTAIIAVFRTSGMRVGELTRLQLADWNQDANVLSLRDTKNGRSHQVFLHPDAVPYLQRWLRVRGTDPGALFSSLNASDRTGPIGRHAVNYMLATRAAAADVAPFGSHDFRRTFATELLRTHDIALVGKLLNHLKPSSTLIYDLADEETQRDAIADLGLPALDHALRRTNADSPDREPAA